MDTGVLQGGDRNEPFTGWDALRIVIAHLVYYVVPVLGSGLLFLVSRNRVLRNHSRAALNYQCTVLVVFVAFFTFTQLGQFLIQQHLVTLGLHFFVLVVLSVFFTFPPVLIVLYSVFTKKRDIVYPYTFDFLKRPAVK